MGRCSHPSRTPLAHARTLRAVWPAHYGAICTLAVLLVCLFHPAHLIPGATAAAAAAAGAAGAADADAAGSHGVVSKESEFIFRQDLFDDSLVHRLDITLFAPSSWEESVADAKERCTQRALASNSRDWRTSPFYLACEELDMRDRCTVTFGSKTFVGICADAFFESVKLCTPAEAIVAGVSCRSLKLNQACSVMFASDEAERQTTHGFCAKDGIGENLVCLTPGFLEFINFLTRTAYWEPLFAANVSYSVHPSSALDVRSFVGLRLDGRASMCAPLINDLKQVPLLLDFGAYVAQEITNARSMRSKLNQIARTRPLSAFHGHWQLILRGGLWDISRIRAKLLADALISFGVRAPRVAHYTVHVNNQFKGVYTGQEEARGWPIRIPMNWPPGDNVASIPATSGAHRQLFDDADDCAAQAQLETDLQQLYDAREHQFKDSNVSAPIYEPLAKFTTLHLHTFYPMVRNASKIDFKQDATALFTTLHSDLRFTDPAQWRVDLQQVFQVDSFLRWLAVNYVFENYDTYGLVEHNYRLYKSPCSGKFHFVPYDFDWSMQPKSSSIALDMSSMKDDWPLISNIIADPIYSAYYLKVLQLFVEEYFTIEYMSARVHRLNQQIKAHVLTEDVSVTGSEREPFEASTDAILEYVRNRRADVLEQVGRMSKTFKERQQRVKSGKTGKTRGRGDSREDL